MDAPGCPWNWLAPASGGFCEASLCAWVRQPGNTWSNVGFIVVGLVILHQGRTRDRAHLMGLGYVAIATGIGSAFYHASDTFVGRVADYIGMYLGSVYMLSANVRRAFLWNLRRVRILFWTVFTILLAGMVLMPRFAELLYIAQMSTCCLCIEYLIYRRQGASVNYRWLFGYWSLFAVAYGIWILDIKRIVCNPSNHIISGHAIWHLLNAFALYLLYLYYLQFDVLRFQEDRRERFTIGS